MEINISAPTISFCLSTSSVQLFYNLTFNFEKQKVTSANDQLGLNLKIIEIDQKLLKSLHITSLHVYGQWTDIINISQYEYNFSMNKRTCHEKIDRSNPHMKPVWSQILELAKWRENVQTVLHYMSLQPLPAQPPFSFPFHFHEISDSIIITFITINTITITSWKTHVTRAWRSKHVVQERIKLLSWDFVCLSKEEVRENKDTTRQRTTVRNSVLA